MRNTSRSSVLNFEMKRQLGRLRRRCKDNIKMNVKDVECEDMDWTVVAVDGIHWRTVLFSTQ